MLVNSMAGTAPIALAPTTAPEAPCEAREAKAAMASDELVTGSGAPAETSALPTAEEANFWLDWYASTWFARTFTNNWFATDRNEDEKKLERRRARAQERVSLESRTAAAVETQGLSLKQCMEACKDLQEAARFQLKVAALKRQATAQ